MSIIVLEKAPGLLLRPVDEQSIKIVSGWKLGQGVKVEAKRMRDLIRHKRFFALVGFVAENSDVYDTIDKALVAVKIAAGHVDWVLNPVTGDMSPLPKSISFENLDEDDFRLFYEAAVNGVLKWVLPQMNRTSIDRAIDVVAHF